MLVVYIYTGYFALNLYSTPPLDSIELLDGMRLSSASCDGRRRTYARSTPFYRSARIRFTPTSSFPVYGRQAPPADPALGARPPLARRRNTSAV